jgi:hypothetical protein
MIILDEELQGLGLEVAISRWYRGAVLDQAGEIPELLRRLLRLPEFRTKRARMGKATLVSRRVIQYYSTHDKLIHIRGWPQ